jgi:hypothetical protein
MDWVHITTQMVILGYFLHYSSIRLNVFFSGSGDARGTFGAASGFLLSTMEFRSNIRSQIVLHPLHPWLLLNGSFENDGTFKRRLKPDAAPNVPLASPWLAHVTSQVVQPRYRTQICIISRSAKRAIKGVFIPLYVSLITWKWKSIYFYSILEVFHLDWFSQWNCTKTTPYVI